MQHFSYATVGTCSKQIDFDLEGNTIHNVSFLGGCDGNLKAISKLVEGKDITEIISILSGNTCGQNLPVVQISWHVLVRLLMTKPTHKFKIHELIVKSVSSLLILKSGTATIKVSKFFSLV